MIFMLYYMFQIALPKKYEKLIGHSFPLFLLSLQPQAPEVHVASRVYCVKSSNSPRLLFFWKVHYHISELIKKWIKKLYNLSLIYIIFDLAKIILSRCKLL